MNYTATVDVITTAPLRSATAPLPARTRVIIVTGVSGGGRASALAALEDRGFDTVDNPPLRLATAIVQDAAVAPASPQNLPPRKLALGLDARSWDFAPEVLLRLLEELRADPLLDVTVLFLEARADVLLRRYSETRRPHPLLLSRPSAAAQGMATATEAGASLPDAIAREALLTQPVRTAADTVVDTSDFTPAALRRHLEALLTPGSHAVPQVTVLSFGFRHGVPVEADCVQDVRFLRNPHYVPELREHDGRNPDVAAYVQQDADYPPFLAQWLALFRLLWPRYVAEGRQYLTLAFGCTGGKHRSVALAEAVAAELVAQGIPATARHRDAERDTTTASPSTPPEQHP